MPAVPTLAHVVALLEGRAAPDTAEDWDRVGLVAGDPQAECGSVRFTVDVTEQVTAAALAADVALIVAHHPLLLRGVHSVAPTTLRGRILTDLIRGGCGLLTMHTNADQAAGGVNDVLADAVGMVPQRRPVRSRTVAVDRLVVYVPEDEADDLVRELAAAGAGRIGEYEECAYWVDGTGQFRPSPSASPHVGEPGTLSRVAERRVEMVMDPGATEAVVAALRVAHPYEEPAFSVVPSRPLAAETGLGRWGAVPPTTAADLARHLAAVLPATAAGVRLAGAPERPVRSVAVCGGAGDSLLADVARLPVDAYVTSDLRHHPALDFVGDHGTVLIDVPHAAGEALWLQSWADTLLADAQQRDWQLTADVAAGCTDPWTAHYPSGAPQ